MKNPPVIGIPCAIVAESATSKAYCGVKRTYIAAILSAGGIPLPISCGLSEPDVRKIYRQCDGLLFAGGGDIDPQHYGQDNSKGLSRGISPERDALELTLARFCIADQKPLLGICRGAQLLNIVLGGTLIQDLPERLGNVVNHRPGYGDSDTAHAISVESDTRLRRILAKQDWQVNSRHHQGLDRLGEGVMVSARSEKDGVIEAIECAGWFCVGVQWHPEDLCAVDPCWEALFRSFITACSSQ
ncbi:MAG: gamma-glutamyl-gamma-aminobutyrate hydrolase family protein [Oligoflexia bacterium]|nr:gamma-glutamyl-gamma-aminobutyrate hydrolase family protein [Oligoflexia bacterium]